MKSIILEEEEEGGEKRLEEEGGKKDCFQKGYTAANLQKSRIQRPG